MNELIASITLRDIYSQYSQYQRITMKFAWLTLTTPIIILQPLLLLLSVLSSWNFFSGVTPGWPTTWSNSSGDGGGGHWLVWMEWRPAGWSVCLPLLIFPCTIKSRSSLLVPAHPGGPGKCAVKRLWCGVVVTPSWPTTHKWEPLWIIWAVLLHSGSPFCHQTSIKTLKTTHSTGANQWKSATATCPFWSSDWLLEKLDATPFVPVSSIITQWSTLYSNVV